MTLQNGAYAADLAFWRNVTNTWNPLVPNLASPIPGDDGTFQSFRDVAGVTDENGRPIAPDARGNRWATHFMWAKWTVWKTSKAVGTVLWSFLDFLGLLAKVPGQRSPSSAMTNIGKNLEIREGSSTFQCRDY